MPLLDHFRPPVYPRHRWGSFHSNWATRIADALNESLPEEFLAEEFTFTANGLEIDVATYEEKADTAGAAGSTAVLTWKPETAPRTMPLVFPDHFEIRVIERVGGMKLVAAIELVSPGNKDRAEECRYFAHKVSAYLQQGIAVVVIDIVTTRKTNLHNETIAAIGGPSEMLLPSGSDLYAVSYRPVKRAGKPELDVWPETFKIGDELPTMPLRLTGDTFVPVEFEAAYMEACRRRRIT
jgi:hypothetical protein